MKINISNHVYEMTKEQSVALVKTLKDVNKHEYMIVALEKEDYLECRNDTFKNLKELKNSIKEYEAQGFVVHYCK